jgi:hypothetical protein
MDGTGGPGARITRAVLTRPEYSGLNGIEKATVTFFAVQALLIVESGRCGDAVAEEAAVETFLLTFLGLSHKSLKPVVALPDTRKTELVDAAMQLASEEEGRIAGCPEHLLSEGTVKPLNERRERAHNVLLHAILAARSD